ncbi:MAG: transposase [Thauera sp.]
MARQPRLVIPGLPQHVIQRGNNRQAIFAAERDYLLFLDLLQASAERFGVQVHAYVLMTNHVHLLVTPATHTGVAQMMQAIGRRYVRHFNDTQGRTGALWEGRYRATVVESARYLLACMRYIELNPVRANLARTPGDYRWSSYRCNAHGQPDPLVVVHDEYQALARDAEARMRAYRQLFCVDAHDARYEDIRLAASKAWALGSDRFIAEIERLCGRRATARPRGGDHKSDGFRRINGV